MSAPVQLLSSNPRTNYLAHKDEIDSAIARVLDSGWYVLGEEVAAFENEFAAYIGASFAIGLGSGTDALHLALRACNIGRGDEVVTVSHTAVATVAAIELCGACPVLVDIDLMTYTMDPDQIVPAITQQTKAIVPVHLYGHPVEMESIMSIAENYNLWVIEDCSQSHGAVYRDRMTGTWGHIAAFSFYPTKNLGAIGDGGMVVTNDSALAERVKLLRQYGWRQRYVSDFPGLNSRLDELQAAILRVKLRYLAEVTLRRQVLAGIYDEMLSVTNLVLPRCAAETTHVYHQYVVRSEYRDSLREFLKEKGIGTIIHYPVPVHLQPAYINRLKNVGSLRETEKAADEVLSLPLYPEMNEEQINTVVGTILSFAEINN